MPMTVRIYEQYSRRTVDESQRVILQKLVLCSYRKLTQAFTKFAMMYNQGVYDHVLLSLQSNLNGKLKSSLTRLRNHAKQQKILKLAKLASLRLPLHKLSDIVDMQIGRKQTAFDLLKTNLKNKTSNYISRIMYLLSQKFRKRIDEKFLNEQIKYMILKNKIHQKSIINFVKDSEIEINVNDYESENKIEKLERLVKLYRAIELFCPLDLYFFKIKQTYNRLVFRSICMFIKLKEHHAKLMRINKGLTILTDKLMGRVKSGFIGIRRFKRKHYKNFALIIGLVAKHQVDLSLKAAMNQIRRYKLRDRKTWLLFVLHNRFHFAKKYHFLLMCLTCLHGEDIGSFSKDNEERRSMISHSLLSQNHYSYVGERPRKSMVVHEDDNYVTKPRIHPLNEQENNVSRLGLSEAFNKLQKISHLSKSHNSSREKSQRRPLAPVDELQNEKELRGKNEQFQASPQTHFAPSDIKSSVENTKRVFADNKRNIEIQLPKAYAVSAQSEINPKHYSTLIADKKKVNVKPVMSRSRSFRINSRTNAAVLYLDNLVRLLELSWAFIDIESYAEARLARKQKILETAARRMVAISESAARKHYKENIRVALRSLQAYRPPSSYKLTTGASRQELKKGLRDLMNFTKRKLFAAVNKAFLSIRFLEINYEIIEVEDMTKTLDPISIVLPSASLLNQTHLLNTSVQQKDMNVSFMRANGYNPKEITVLHQSSLIPHDVQIERLHSIIKPSIHKLVQKDSSRIYEQSKQPVEYKKHTSQRRNPSENFTDTKESLLLNPSHYQFQQHQVETPSYSRLPYPQFQVTFQPSNLKNYKSEKKIPTLISIPKVQQSFKFK